MPVSFFFLFALMILYPASSPCAETGRTQVFETEGIAAVVGSDLAHAREGAVQDALQKAVIRATGQWLNPQDVERKYLLLKERIYERADEYTQAFRILFELSDPDIYSVTVRVTVFSDKMRNDLQNLGLIAPPASPPSVITMFLMIRGIRTFGDYVRLRGTLKERVPGIRELVIREASWRSARFDVVAEGTVADFTERLREKLRADIQHQDDRFLEFNLR